MATTELPEEMTPCTAPGMDCTNPAHVHEAIDDQARDSRGALLCAECGAPAHWDEAGDYDHDSPDTPGCFLIPKID
jgi:hypothetical protein